MFVHLATFNFWIYCASILHEGPFPPPPPTNIVKISGYCVIYEQPLGCFVRAEFKWQRCCWWIWRGGPCGKLWLIFVSLAPLSNFANTEKKSQNRFHFQREVCYRQDTLGRQKAQCWTYSTILSKPQATNGQQQQRTTPPALNMSRKKSSKTAKKTKVSKFTEASCASTAVD